MVKKINEFRELQKKKGKKGFSMIELIIVIAIMAILVALIGTQLIPYLEKSREKRDMTTLDTCMTAFQSALTDKEATLTGDTTLANAITKGLIDEADFEKYAGIEVDADNIFKSENAKGAKAEDITFKATSDGVITGAEVKNSTATKSVVVSRTGASASS